jgi:hypothetical protein
MQQPWVRGGWWVLAAALAATEWLYPKSAPIYDDLLHLKLNPFVRDWDFTSILTTPYWKGVESAYVQENLYRPFFLVLLALLQGVPVLLRVLALGVHFANARILARVLERDLRLSPVLALVCGATFLFHPANSEVISQHVGLQDSFAHLMGVTAIYWLDRRPGLSFALVAFAPGWKEIGLVWLAGATVLQGFRRRWNWAGLGLGAILCWMMIRYLIYGSVAQFERVPYPGQNPLVLFTGLEALISKISLIGHQLRLLVWPVRLSSDYSIGTLPIPVGIFHWASILGISFVIAAALIALGVIRKRVLPIFWVGGATLLPTLHLLTPIGALFAERFGYGFRWAVVGVLGGFAGALAAKASSSARWAALGLATVMITVSYAGLFQRLVLWTDPVLLFSHDAEVYPSNPKIQINLGNAFAQRGRWLEAALAYGRAVEISPDNPDSRLKLGLAYRVLGRRHESVQQLLEAKRLGNPFADEYLR